MTPNRLARSGPGLPPCPTPEGGPRGPLFATIRPGPTPEKARKQSARKAGIVEKNKKGTKRESGSGYTYP